MGVLKLTEYYNERSRKIFRKGASFGYNEADIKDLNKIAENKLSTTAAILAQDSDLNGKLVLLKKSLVEEYCLDLVQFFWLEDFNGVLGKIVEEKTLNFVFGNKPRVFLSNSPRAVDGTISALSGLRIPAIKSIALIPIFRKEKMAATFLLGSNKSTRYKPDMGVDLLEEFSRRISRIIWD